jgi:hypothetical protein
MSASWRDAAPRNDGRLEQSAPLMPIRARCDPPLDAFEVNVSVRQPTALGSTLMLGTPFHRATGGGTG